MLASREILRLAREDPDELDRQIELQTEKASAEDVLRPESRYPPYEDDARPAPRLQARRAGAAPERPVRLAYRPGRKMGYLAQRLDQPRILYRGLRPEALATLLYLAKEYRRDRGQGGARCA